MENATWRAANLQVPTREQVNKIVRSRMTDLTGAAVERGYKLVELANKARGAKRMTWDD